VAERPPVLLGRMKAMNPDLRRRTDELCSRLTQLRDSL
jgi:hypothetical protein